MEKYTDKKLEQMRDAYNTPDNKSKAVPMENIKMEYHEGRTDKRNYEGKNFKSWSSYQRALKQIDKDNKGDRKKGTYTKTKATVTWKDGTQRSARIDLGPNDYNPNKEEIGTYWKKTNLQDGAMTDKGWKATKGKFIKSRTGRELSTGNDWIDEVYGKTDSKTKSLRKKLRENPHQEGTELYEVYNRNVLTDAFYDDKMVQSSYSRQIKESLAREKATREYSDSMVKIEKFKKEEPRAFQSAVDMQVEEDIKNNSRWDSFTDKDNKELRARLVRRYNNNPKLIKDKWYMATMRVYESKDFSKYLKDEAFMKGSAKGNRGRSGPMVGKGWHGEQIRHRNAAMKGRGMRR